jgi:GNAT superfamily N-acetyltransferase
MRSSAISNRGRFELRRPETETEWMRYHSIRERALWGNVVQGEYGAYNPDHPVQYSDVYKALVMLRNDIVIGTMGLQDTGEHGNGPEIEVRGVAIDPACQGQGYGGILLMLGECAAKRAGFSRAGVWAGADLVLFYARSGYIYRPENMPTRIDCPVPGNIAMTKRLDLGVAQNDGTVLIAAA